MDHPTGDTDPFVQLRPILEAILLIVDEPIQPDSLAEVVRVDPDTITAALTRLAGDYEAEGRGFVLAQRGGGWRLWTHPDQADIIERFIVHNKKSQLSRAALETLAIVVYKQPVTRSEIGDIRAVNPDGAISTLVSRGLIEVVGRADLPGRPVVYAPTVKTLEVLGINSVEELPSLDQFAPGGAAPPEPPKGDYRTARRHIDVIDEDATGRGERLSALIRQADDVMRTVRSTLETQSQPFGTD